MVTSLRIRRFLPATSAEGPGRRACLWVQGCSIHCPGCFNRHMWDLAGGQEMSVDALEAAIGRSTGIEGITFLGGEPFDQAPALAELGVRLQCRGLSVMTFTGYLFEDLRDSPRDGWPELLAVTDLLVDGPYIAARPDLHRPWVGSTNQRFLFLTPRYRSLAGRLRSLPDRLEVRIGADGTVFVNGQAPDAQLWGLLRDLGLRRAPSAARPAASGERVGLHQSTGNG